MKGKAILNIYIGPANLCPCPSFEDPFLIISGDNSKTSKRIIENKAEIKDRSPKSCELLHGVIGKEGNEKNWYTFNKIDLNGIFPKNLIQWCNKSVAINMTSTYKIKAKKLESILNSTKLSHKDNCFYHLMIAQGDPFLTLKRSRNVIDKCIAIDLSTHPLGLVWKESIDDFLSDFNFANHPNNKLVWILNSVSPDDIKPCFEICHSEMFIDKTLQILIKSISLKQYNLQNPEFGNLQLLRRIAVDDFETLKRDPSIKKLITDKAKKKLKKINNLFQRAIKGNEHEKYRLAKNINALKQQSKDHSTDINSKSKLRYSIDGFENNLCLYGWIDTSNFGVNTSTIKIYWEEKNELLAETLANIERPDLRKSGIVNSTCGFSQHLYLIENLDFTCFINEKISLKLVESKSNSVIGGKLFKITDDYKDKIIPYLVSSKFNHGKYHEILEFLSHSKNQRFLATVRIHLLNLSCIFFKAGKFNEIPIRFLLDLYQLNPSLDYGKGNESATRLELLFYSLIALFKETDKDDIYKLKTDSSIFPKSKFWKTCIEPHHLHANL